MAIARGSGTEIIRCAMFENIDADTTTLIYGEQHHIYTVLSIVINCVALHTAGNQVNINFQGYDAKGGTTNQTMRLFRWIGVDNETFVWNDKFSFNGHEPVDFAEPMGGADFSTGIADQNAIADQGTSVQQRLWTNSSQANDQFEIMITYIDQNNS